MSQEGRHNVKQEDFDILYVLRQILKRWYWFALCIPIFLALAVMKNRTAVPMYSISSKLLIEVASDRVIYDEEAAAGVNMLTRSKSVNNEIQVIHSRDLIERALDSLAFNVRYFNPATRAEILGHELPIDIRADFDKAHRLAGTEFEFRTVDESKFILSADGVELGVLGYGQMIEHKDFHFIVSKRPKQWGEADFEAHLNFFIDTRDAVVDQYLNNLVVMESDKDTDAIDLSLEETIPERGELFLNQLVQSYFMKMLEDRKRAAETTYDFIDERLQENFAHLDSLEQQIDKFKRDKEVVNPAVEARYILQGIKQFEIELSDAETQLEIVEDLVTKSLSNPSSELDLSVPNTTNGVTDPLLNELVMTLNRKQYELKTLSQTVTKDNPIYRELVAEIDDLRGSIMIDLLSMRDNMRTSVRYIQNQIDEYKFNLDQLSHQEKGLVAMERIRANKEELYVYLLKKREEAAMVLASELMDTWVIEQPHASSLYYNPKRGIVLLLGLFLGVFIPLSVILVWMFFDGRIRRDKELTSLVSIPLIATLSSVKRPVTRIKSAIRKVEVAEGLRQADFNLRYHAKDGKVTLMTSLRAREARNLTALNLAITKAALGHRTCLIELDLRRPSLDRLSGLQDEQGIVSVIMGDKSAAECTQAYPDQEGLDLILAGTCPPDPSSLLVDEKLDRLIAQLCKTYDAIIIDTPPLNAVSDTLLVSRLADTTLLVVEEAVSRRSDLKAFGELLSSGKLARPAVLYLSKTTSRSTKDYLPQHSTAVGRWFATIKSRLSPSWRA